MFNYIFRERVTEYIDQATTEILTLAKQYTKSLLPERMQVEENQQGYNEIQYFNQCIDIIEKRMGV